MDKETLSNYGWIVICVLVMVVMIALATPFGSFISEAVQSTTQGLFDVNQNALNSTGLINIDNQEFDVPNMNHDAIQVTYNMLDGAGQVITTPANTVFRSDAEYSKFDSVKVDDNAVDASNYTVSEGSTIVTLKESYVATLSNGTHKLEIISKDGSASCEFAVNIASEPVIREGYLSGTWKFNDALVVPEENLVENIEFSTIEGDNHVSYNHLGIYPGFGWGISVEVSYNHYLDDGTLADGGTMYTMDKWYDESIQTITFTHEQQVSMDFWNWFTANATQQ